MGKKLFLLALVIMSVLSANAQRRVYNSYRHGYYYVNSRYADEVYYYNGARRVYVERDPYIVYDRPAVVERIVEKPVYVETPVYIEKPVVVEKPVVINNTVYQEINQPDEAYYVNKRNVRVSGFESYEESVATQWTLVFNIGSYNITTASLPDLHNIKKFYQTYPDCTFEILAYSDRNTGTSAGNMRLSRQRGEAIAKYLNETKGIPYSKISMDYYGSDKQVYVSNDWNRCVVVRARFD